MSYNNRGVSPRSFRCTIAIAQYAAVMLDGTTKDNIVVTSAITDDCIGFTQQAGAAGEMVPVADFGEQKAIASTTIAVNAPVMCDAAGKVTTQSGATSRGVGVALSAAGTGGADIITIRVRLSNKNPASA